MSNPTYPDLLILTFSCPMKWDEMEGTQAVRHCRQCSLNVVNITHSSEAEVDQLFERSRCGERVCIRSEGRGTKTADSKKYRPLQVGFAAAMSLFSGWALDILRMPVAAAEKSRNSSAVSRKYVYLDADVPDLSPRPRRGGTSSVASRKLPNVLWEQIHKLEGIVLPGSVVDPFEGERLRIVKRAFKDRFVSTDEVIHLSNSYRAAGFKDAADQILALATTLLDLGQRQHGSCSQDVHLDAETPDLIQSDRAGGVLSSTGATPRYGFGVMLARNGSDAIWNQLYRLKSIVLPGQVVDPFKSERDQIVARATKDRVVSTDEVIRLSNNYRTAGFDAAADQVLGLAIDLLDATKLQPVNQKRFKARIGEIDETVQGFGYSQTKAADLLKYTTLLSMSSQQLSKKDYLGASECLRQALICCLSNPLVVRETQQSDIAARIADLKPFLAEWKFDELVKAQASVQSRFDDLSELKQ